jgi:LuxR family quorum-sensing transcriptional regulator LasR
MFIDTRTDVAANTVFAHSTTAKMEIENILNINYCRTEGEVRDAVFNTARFAGFDFFHYVGDFYLDRHNRIRKMISNFTKEWIARYAACEYEKVDPAFEHALMHVTPLIWSSFCRHNISTEQRQYLDDARQHGIGNGISFPIQTRNGDNAILSFANTVGRSDTDDIVIGALAVGSLAARFVHDAMRRIVDKDRNVLQAPLTHRELECLRWIAIGKSNWEIAMIFGMTEHGVVYYVRKLLWKFGVSSRYEAVARATACGLL